jgi:hypothetical protein
MSLELQRLQALVDATAHAVPAIEALADAVLMKQMRQVCRAVYILCKKYCEKTKTPPSELSPRINGSEFRR